MPKQMEAMQDVRTDSEDDNKNKNKNNVESLASLKNSHDTEELTPRANGTYRSTDHWDQMVSATWGHDHHHHQQQQQQMAPKYDQPRLQPSKPSDTSFDQQASENSGHASSEMSKSAEEDHGNDNETGSDEDETGSDNATCSIQEGSYNDSISTAMSKRGIHNSEDDSSQVDGKSYDEHSNAIAGSISYVDNNMSGSDSDSSGSGSGSGSGESSGGGTSSTSIGSTDGSSNDSENDDNAPQIHLVTSESETARPNGGSSSSATTADESSKSPSLSSLSASPLPHGLRNNKRERRQSQSDSSGEELASNRDDQTADSDQLSQKSHHRLLQGPPPDAQDMQHLRPAKRHCDDRQISSTRWDNWNKLLEDRPHESTQPNETVQWLMKVCAVSNPESNTFSSTSLSTTCSSLTSHAMQSIQRLSKSMHGDERQPPSTGNQVSSTSNNTSNNNEGSDAGDSNVSSCGTNSD